MKLLKILGVATALAGLTALTLVVAPSVYGQPRGERIEVQEPLILEGPGSRVGASVRDLTEAEAKVSRGVFVEQVRPNSPAEKAGLKPSDIVTRFDGENVRSAQQFARLVRETPPDRTVAATIVRGGRSMELSMTPTAAPGPDVFGGRRDEIAPRLREQLDMLGDRIGRIPFELEMRGIPFGAPGARLGVTIGDLTPQLATYFGAKAGVLVSSVSEDSPASRAGLTAGDVITSINGESVQSRDDLLRVLRNVNAPAEVTIGIVREKKESSVKARLEGPQRSPQNAQRPRRRV